MRKDDPNLYHRRMRRVDLLVEARRHAGGGIGPVTGEPLQRLGSQESSAGWASPGLRPGRSKLARSRLAMLDAPTVQPRDLRLVDPLFASSQEPAIEPRRGCIIVNLPPTRAIVTRDRCYFIPSDGVDEELRTLADRVLCSASAAAAAEAAAEAAAIAAAEAAEDARYGNSSDTPTAAEHSEELASLQERGRALSHCLESVLESPSAMARLDLTAVETARCKEVERRAMEQRSALAEARYAMRRRGAHQRGVSSSRMSPLPFGKGSGQATWVGPDGSTWVRMRRESHADDTSDDGRSSEAASVPAAGPTGSTAAVASGRDRQSVRSGLGRRSHRSQGGGRSSARSASAPVREAVDEGDDEDEDEDEDEDGQEQGEDQREEQGEEEDAASASGVGADVSRRDVALLRRTPERRLAGAGPHDSDDEEDDPMPELMLHEDVDDDSAAAAFFGDAVELLLESYLGEVEAALSDARKLQNEAETSERQLSLLLSASRNALLRTDLTISVVGVCLALLSAIGGFMGMNVPNGLETASSGTDGPFTLIVAVSTASATVLAVVVLLFLQRFLRVSAD
ncbi:hypothetical protein FNF27_03136 [Cafeteria roenbergensis]|uniref:Magnesium transporter n=1 Tax=Cafeteria roenbergensis TaxID=33653 RepID=A0A5A8EC61_CAFRO|nr:hypothetical protein FNF27_03136 [Cafeteria roenbergensis]